MFRCGKTSLILVFGLLVLSACTKQEAKGKTEAAAKPPVAVEAAGAAAADLVEGIEVTGTLEPKLFADVKTQVSGLIRSVYVTEWVRVRKGQPLATIDVAETEALVKRAEASVESARAGLAEAEVTSGRADRELARALKLREAGLATLQAVDDARSLTAAGLARIEAAKAHVRVAEEELRQARTRLSKGVVRSPIDGVVALRSVNVGDLAGDAAAGKTIFRIVDNSLLNLTVTVPSVDSARVKVGQALEFIVDSIPGRSFAGKVMYVNPEVSSSDRSLRVMAEVRNVPEILKGGLFAKGRIVAGKRSNVVQVPRQALSGWDTATGKANLFVVENGTAHLRSVNTGAVSGDLVEIAAGLKAGESYVRRGSFALKDGDKVALAAAAAVSAEAGR